MHVHMPLCLLYVVYRALSVIVQHLILTFSEMGRDATEHVR